MRPANLFRRYRKIINPPYSGKDFAIIFATLFILISIPLTVVLSQQALRWRSLAAQIIVAPGSSINSAVASAQAGDTILVKAGTYREQIDIGKAITIQPYGDGTVTLDEECTRDYGFYIGAGSGITIKGMTVKKTIGAGVHMEPAGSPVPSNVTIDGMTIQDFDCQELSGDNFRGGIASYYAGANMTITNNTITRRVELSGTQRGWADGIWFKSRDANPSGGGHRIAGNTITGGWDGIGGEEEFSSHGSFDKDTIIEDNTIRDCDDDGIQSEGGGQNIRIRNNDIAGCGAGIAFAAPYTGPLYIENNYIHDLRTGEYGNLFCYKTGNSSDVTVYLTGNRCIVNSAAEQALGGADGIHQTNSGMYPIISRNNIFQTSRYIFEIYEPYGGSYDHDCMYTTDSSRFVKWGTESGTQYYTSLAQFQSATGEELTGRQTTECSFLGGDPTAPTVSITSPTNGATVSGSSVTVAANATDNVGVTKVEFYVDTSTKIGEDTTSPYSISWNTTIVSNGTHTLSAKAYDAAGNVGTSSNVSVTVSNGDSQAPTVSITSPTNGATVSGTVTISATASDNVGVSRVEFYYDSTNLIGTDTTSPYSASWNTMVISNGSHSLLAKAYDAANNVGTSATITVNVSNTGKIGDLNSDGKVDIFDLSILLTRWGSNDTTADLNHNGTVDIFDLSILLTHWGE